MLWVGDVFSVLGIICGVMVISGLNSVHSVLWLIAAFVCVGIVFILMGVEFVGWVLLIVYVGAIAVLFLFVVMMLNLTDFPGLLDMTHYIPVGLMVGIGVYMGVLLSGGWEGGIGVGLEYNRWDLVEKISNIGVLGGVIYTDYGYLLILAGYILLVAMVGAIVLTLGEGIDRRRGYRKK